MHGPCFLYGKGSSQAPSGLPLHANTSELGLMSCPLAAGLGIIFFDVLMSIGIFKLPPPKQKMPLTVAPSDTETGGKKSKKRKIIFMELPVLMHL